jgi:hypothetical protein
MKKVFFANLCVVVRVRDLLRKKNRFRAKPQRRKVNAKPETLFIATGKNVDSKKVTGKRQKAKVVWPHFCLLPFYFCLHLLGWRIEKFGCAFSNARRRLHHFASVAWSKIHGRRRRWNRLLLVRRQLVILRYILLQFLRR